MATSQQPSISNRDKHLSRLREKYPDKKFEDDEEIYGQISDDYDNYENELSVRDAREKSIVDMFDADPRTADFIVDVKNGESPVKSMLKHFGPDVKTALEDPKKVDELAELWAQDQERIAKSKKLDEQYAANMQQSLDAISQFQQEQGLTDEQTDELITTMLTVVRDGVMGKFEPSTLLMFLNAINHDADVADARDEGTVAGRNQKVTEKLRKREQGDGIGMLGGKNSSPKQQRGGTIFDTASEAQSNWG